jgi:hypothetical protein
VRIQRARFAETITNRSRKSVCARFDKSGSKTLATFSVEGGCAFTLPSMSKLPFELLLALRYLQPKRTSA